jgi:hypothetical protein
MKKAKFACNQAITAKTSAENLFEYKLSTANLKRLLSWWR